MKYKQSISKLKLDTNGILSEQRIQPFIPSLPNKNPSKRLNRIQELIQTRSPKIAIVRGEGIGDVLMTLPSVHALRSLFKDIEITYATNFFYLDGALVDILRYNPDINVIKDRQQIKEEDFDLVINLQCPCVHYEKHENPPINRIDLFANYIGIQLADTKIRYFLQDQEIERMKEKISAIEHPFILVQPSASNPRRSLDHQKMKNVLKRLYKDHNIKSLILTHDSDYETSVCWDNVLGGYLFHNLRVREIAALMSQCDLVLCQDSSILHLAGALDIPTVALFGPTHPDARINYYPNAIAIWGGKGITRCPCWFQPSCPIGEICWKNIREEDIIDGCLNQLSKDLKHRPLNITNLITMEII